MADLDAKVETPWPLECPHEWAGCLSCGWTLLPENIRQDAFVEIVAMLKDDEQWWCDSATITWPEWEEIRAVLLNKLATIAAHPAGLLLPAKPEP